MGLLAPPRAVLELDRGQAVLSRRLDHLPAPPAREHGLHDHHVVDVGVEQGFLNAPAGMDSLQTDAAPMQLDRHNPYDTPPFAGWLSGLRTTVVAGARFLPTGDGYAMRRGERSAHRSTAFR